MDMNRMCMMGIAACDAVDKVRARFKDPHGMFEEEFTIEVGIEFDKRMKEQEEQLTRMLDVVGVG